MSQEPTPHSTTQYARGDTHLEELDVAGGLDHLGGEELKAAEIGAARELHTLLAALHNADDVSCNAGHSCKAASRVIGWRGYAGALASTLEIHLTSLHHSCPSQRTRISHLLHALGDLLGIHLGH